MESPIKERHCAFCLQSIVDKSIKLCAKCRRRAYCSRDCQIADWSSDGKGQGHKNWCHLTCGEEDIDWQVSTIPGKGLGLVAKRQLPALYRIIVDCCHHGNDHPAINDLMPIAGTYEEKFELNCIGHDNGESSLCLRISRANHDCNANAGHWYDETFKVVVLFAQRDIAVGEEITINYQLFNDISCDVSADMSRFALQTKWGIICPMNCICYDKEVEKLITKARQLDKQIVRLAEQGKSLQSVNIVKELIKIHETIKSSLLNKSRTLYDGFQVAVMQKKSLDAAKSFLDQLHRIQSAVLSPESSAVKKTEGLMKTFSIK